MTDLNVLITYVLSLNSIYKELSQYVSWLLLSHIAFLYAIITLTSTTTVRYME